MSLLNRVNRARVHPVAQRRLSQHVGRGAILLAMNPTTSLTLGLLATKIIAEEKQFAVVAEVFDEAGLAMPSSSISWTFSKRLEGPYVYVPPTLSRGIVWLSPLRAGRKVGSVKLRIYRLTTQAPPAGRVFSERIFERYALNVGGAPMEVIGEMSPKRGRE